MALPLLILRRARFLLLRTNRTTEMDKARRTAAPVRMEMEMEMVIMVIQGTEE